MKYACCLLAFLVSAVNGQNQSLENLATSEIGILFLTLASVVVIIICVTWLCFCYCMYSLAKSNKEQEALERAREEDPRRNVNFSRQREVELIRRERQLIQQQMEIERSIRQEQERGLSSAQPLNQQSRILTTLQSFNETQNGESLIDPTDVTNINNIPLENDNNDGSSIDPDDIIDIDNLPSPPAYNQLEMYSRPYNPGR